VCSKTDSETNTGEAPKELGQKERASKGLNGGVIRYVVINGFATPAGFQPAPKGEYSQFPPWMKLDLEVRFYISSSFVFIERLLI